MDSNRENESGESVELDINHLANQAIKVPY